MAKPVRARGLKTLLARVDATINRPPRSGPPAEPEQPAEQASPPAVPPVDEAVISELRNEIDDEDGSALDELIGDYIADSSQMMHELEVAVPVEDTPRISRLTHSWKSTSAILGASQLSALLARAEVAALHAPEELAALITEIQQEHEQVNTSLRHIQTAGRGN